MHQYLGFAATKRALNEALMETDPDSNVLLTCRTAITTAGTALVERAQRAGVIRDDTNFTDVVRMVAGIAMVPTEDPNRNSGCSNSHSTDSATNHTTHRSQHGAPVESSYAACT